jgi:valyl-tRNA synthetase
MRELAKVYDPATFETRWYQHWETQQRFTPANARNGKTFVIVIPPPNVTGALTIGHVLNNTIQDVLIRARRMQGYRTLWLPGMDHAGIATQNVVKNDLAKKGITLEGLGREKFVESVWEWKELYGGRILQQLRRLGCSCDWARERFTLDEGLSKAVEVAFKHLYRKGWIYRGQYLVNWCIGCQTAISDEEVEYRERQSFLWHVRYPVKGTDRFVTVATTRPETILADTAVAVNPDDERYAGLLGKILILPLLHREIPLVADEAVDKEFGTGALKVTPGHDPVDFEIGQRHGLPILSAIDQRGLMTEVAGPYAGMDREEARKAVVRQLEEDGLLDHRESYDHSVGECHRCHTIIEPFLSQQWFVRMKELSQPAIEAARSGEVRFIPERWEKTYLHWLDGIRDWCISRQLWWGHPIPILYCSQGHQVLSGEEADPCPQCGSTQFTPDPDVLDTWFSSWLWPFSTLGWPEQTSDLGEFYPTDDLITAPDIIFFWVARMVMAGYEFTGKKPFSLVHLHGLVRDEEGRKMSKSLGNSPDPIDLIDRYGADALRFTMLLLTPTGTDVLFGEKKIEIGRNFANKLWNAARFALMNLGEDEAALTGAPRQPGHGPLRGHGGHTDLADRWLHSRLLAVTLEAEQKLDEYRLSDLARILYEFTWHEYCDWYLEMAKVRINAGGPGAVEARRGILFGLCTALRLLHPLIPFITEEIWHHLPGTEGDLIDAPWPDVATRPAEPGGEPLSADPEAEEAMALLMETVVTVRNIRSEMNVPPSREAAVTIRADARSAALYQECASYLKTLARISELHIGPDIEKPRFAASDVAGSSEVFVHLEGIIDLDLERSRLDRELQKNEKVLASARRKLENPDFLDRAKPEVVEKEREKLLLIEEAMAKLSRARGALEA